MDTEASNVQARLHFYSKLSEIGTLSLKLVLEIDTLVLFSSYFNPLRASVALI